MNKFKIAFAITLSHEGIYSNDPNDRGGETYRGIARKVWPNWEGWEIIDTYKLEYVGVVLLDKLNNDYKLKSLVEQFYYKYYWLRLKCDSFLQPISNELFDTAVNQGQVTAGEYLQKSLNILNRNGKDYNDLKVDGKIGQMTINAYVAYMSTKRFTTRNADKLIKWLLAWMNYYQCERYAHIATKDPSQEKFIPGWTERV